MILWRKLSSKSVYSVLLVFSCLFVFVGCYMTDVTKNTVDSMPVTEDNGEESVSDSQGDIAPTGLSEGMLTPPQIMYQGVIFEYRFTGKSNGLPNGFAETGVIMAVDDYKVPSQDFYAGGRELNLALEQKVFASESDHSRIVVLCDDGYYVFYSQGS